MLIPLKKLIIIYLILSVLLTSVQSGDIPNCNYFDTVKLEDSQKLANGSYKYQDIIVPAELTGDYDYEINYDGERESVPNHTRGCVCKLKSCIRFCCHPKKLMDGTKCSEEVDEDLTYDYTLDVTQINGSVIRKHILSDMVVQQDLPLPCEKHYSLDAEVFKEDMWSLYENGSLFRHFDARHLSKQEFCLQPQLTSTGNNYSLIVAFNCIEKRSMTLAYVKASSTFFMAITIAAYLLLPKFQSLHGKCCNLYFTCLALTFLLNIISMFEIFSPGTLICYLTGYAGYFTVMATFLWLSAISFDVWRRFYTQRFHSFYKNNRSSFFNYNVVVWSSAGFLTTLIFLLDSFLNTELYNPYTPAVGLFSCWICSERWSAMLYLYAPLAILIVLNGAMFFLTTRYIYVENRNNQKVLNKCEQQRESRNQANYRIYLRLFIIMGGSWFLEIIAFVCEMENALQPLVALNDYINCSQGMIIFVATFCNQEMLKSIRKRIQNREGTATDFTTNSRPQEFEKSADAELVK
ncbi:probable G-protein coupled receptor Mth-like 11 isoform X2 [Drosophila biarmipes]|uniref:probable G-protein coupled receptor Mth-like 11 isoform X2 n=1 Tax=Drosophila biarmipes TaxID=125945 RepID=UPI0007E84343|nr:probable G-protein coupled receptor Mth-like 11 isoform X2 [Drosophila biarmipes]